MIIKPFLHTMLHKLLANAKIKYEKIRFIHASVTAYSERNIILNGYERNTLKFVINSLHCVFISYNFSFHFLLLNLRFDNILNRDYRPA